MFSEDLSLFICGGIYKYDNISLRRPSAGAFSCHQTTWWQIAKSHQGPHRRAWTARIRSMGDSQGGWYIFYSLSFLGYGTRLFRLLSLP